MTIPELNILAGDERILQTPLKMRGDFYRLTPYELTSEELTGVWDIINLTEYQSGKEMKRFENTVHPGDTILFIGINLSLSIIAAVMPNNKSSLIYRSVFNDEGYKVKIFCPHG